MHISIKTCTFIPNVQAMLVANMSSPLKCVLWRIIHPLPALDLKNEIYKNSKKSNIMSQNSRAHVILQCKTLQLIFMLSISIH